MAAQTPSVEDLRVAALWCANYEGATDEECAPFLRVQAWLEAQADAKELRENERQMRQVAKQVGVPIERVRERVAEIVRKQRQNAEHGEEPAPDAPRP